MRRSVALAILALCACSASAARVLQQTQSPVVNAGFVQQLTTFTGYQVIFRSGDFTPTSTLPVGTLTDIRGRPLRYADGENTSPNPWGYDISGNPDFASMHDTPAGNLFGITQFEANTPAALYVSKLNQDANGKITPEWFKPTDWSAPEHGGLWTPCAGSITPWGSHAGGEEYEPDAYCLSIATDMASLRACADTAPIISHMRYFGFNPANITFEDIKNNFNPYLYGHAFEVDVIDEEGNVNLTKHYPMGRHSYEMWMSMPDNQTFYASDDGASTAFWRFVADRPYDLSSGSLYGAKFHQLNDVYGGSFRISWIYLGHANQTELVDMVVRQKVKFEDIWATTLPTNGTCPRNYRLISKRDNKAGATCLMLKPGMEKAAAFLESRRYLAYLGGTVELTKFEGITFDPVTHKMYGAMSVIRNSMEDNKQRNVPNTLWDFGGPNDIHVPWNPCGCVYAFDVLENYEIISMYGEVCGVPTSPDGYRNEGNCDIGGLSEPDNVITIGTQGQLIIGEDTNENRIDSIWLYDLFDKSLTRIQTSPFGAETTGPWWHANLNGFAYLGTVTQHPYGESDQDKITAPGSTGKGGWVGAYGFRTSDFANGEKLKFVGIPYPRNDMEKGTVTSSAFAYRLANSMPLIAYGAHNRTGQSLPGPAAGPV